MPGFWRVTVVYGLGVILMNALVLAMQDFLADEPDGIIVLGVVLFVYVAFALLISRYFFGVGARQSVRLRVRR